MAAPSALPRPGVEVIQTFKAPAPTITKPTLAPVMVGPAFEVVNALNSDGTINSKAKFGIYSQLSKAITESSFPDPRGNIDELDVQEPTIRTFMLHGGSLKELPIVKGQGTAFLIAEHVSSKAAIQTVIFSGGTGLALAGTVLVLTIDNPARTDTSEDVVITFTGGGNLTSAQAAAQINTAVGKTVATVVGAAPNDKVQITSPTYGALSSVTVRAGGSANAILQIGYSGGSAAHEERVEGSGFRAQDQNNNTTQSPWIEFYIGAYLLDGAVTAFVSKAGLVNIISGAFSSAAASALTFGAGNAVPIALGDFYFADGVQVQSGEVSKIELSRFKIGTINANLSVADSSGTYLSKVYNPTTFGTIFDATPFAPKYAFFRANGLNWKNVAPTPATLLGATAGAAATAGSVDSGTVSTPASLAGLRIHYVVTIDGVQTDSTFTFTGGPFAAVSDIVTAIGTNITGVVASVNSGKLHLATVLTGEHQAITVKKDGTANSALNFSTSTDTTGTGTDVSFSNLVASLSTSGQTFATTTLTGTHLDIEISSDSGATFPVSKTHSFAGEMANITALVAELNGDATFLGAVLTVTSAGNELIIKSVATGSTTVIRVKSSSTALGAGKLAYTSLQSAQGINGLTGAALKFTLDSNPHVYLVSFSDNSLVDAVTEINTVVGASVASIDPVSGNKLLLTSPLSGLASAVAVQDQNPFGAEKAFGLNSASSPTAVAGTGRPFPDSYLNDASVLHIQSEILRDAVTGLPLDQTNDVGTLYVQYKALRLDVSAVAKHAGVLRIGDAETLGSVLDPITEDNPLSLAMFLAMLNAPNFEIKGLGIDSVTAAAPFGTADAYARSLSLLEAEEVYAMAPLTQDETIHGLVLNHCLAMSAPEQGGERIAFFNKIIPTRANAVVAVSGTQANSTSTANQMLLDTNPAQGLLNAGINPAQPITVAMGVYLEFEVDGQLVRYNVSSVTGSLANLNTTFAAGENDDAFYTTTTLNTSVADAPYSLEVRGASLTIPGSNPARLDYSLVAANVSEANAAIHQRRGYSVFPDTITTTVQGLTKNLPAFYACAAICGMVAFQPPQQGFTNFPITGITGVQGTEKFTKSQMDQMAGGGTYILIQDVVGGPVVSRHQLSTNTDSIEFRELSITKVVDFVAKFLRAGVRRYIGVNVINKDLLDTLGTTVSAILQFLEEAGVLNGAAINQIVQDTSAPDTVIIDVTLDVPFPCNYVRLTLVI